MCRPILLVLSLAVSACGPGTIESPPRGDTDSGDTSSGDVAPGDRPGDPVQAGDDALPDTEAPTVPTGLQATPVSASQIDVQWEPANDNVGVAGYRIFQDTVEVATVSTTSYSAQGLTAETEYGFAVAAFDAAGNESAQCSPVNATTLAVPVVNVPQGLDELFRRKVRAETAVYPASALESAGSWIWQPETVMYHDIDTGHEVWRMTNTPGLSSYYHNDIGVSPWSADGKRIAIASRRPTEAFTSDWWLWLTAHTNGAHLRPTVEAASRTYDSRNNYFHWSPQIPDVYYEVGTGASSPQRETTDLYRTVVSDSSVTTTFLFTFPETIKLDKMISADGTRLLVSSSDEATLYPTTVEPALAVDVPAGYSIDRDMALYGTTPDGYGTAHDRYYGGNGDWYFVMPIGSSHNAWWRLATLGDATDGGALCDNSDFPVTDPGYDFGECWPVNAVNGTDPDPFGSGYWSHFVPDRWGRMALHSCCCTDVCWSSSGPGIGPGVWDIQGTEYVVPTFGGGASHHDWKGFTDWTVSSGSTDEIVDQVLYTQKYDDVSSQITINSAYTGYDGGTGYQILVRPAQSPDGTKVAWHGEFLNATLDVADPFWSVAHYPYPPTDLSAAGNVEIGWLPPRYTERGWPYADITSSPADWPALDTNGNEIGETLYAREVRRYHVWRSTDGSGGWQEVGAVDAEYDVFYTEDANLFMLHPVVNGLRVAASNPVTFTDNPGDGTFYYAITTEEHSGLESRGLSEIIEVQVSGATVTSHQIVAGAGHRDFANQAPMPPAAFTVVAPGTAGHYRLTWAEPAADSTRYYNIYYATDGDPAIDRSTRVLSPPVGTTTILDWLADPAAGAPTYGITTVDRHGNESAPVFASP